MKLLVFDNYDSFTYNIVQLLREAGADDITVVRNDRIALEAVGRFDKIILSPGPGIPFRSGHPVATDPGIRTEQKHLRRMSRRTGDRRNIRGFAQEPHGCLPRHREPYPDYGARPAFRRSANGIRCGTLSFVDRQPRRTARMNFKLRPKTKPDRSWPWHTGATTCAECSFIPNRYSRPTAGK